jgi:ABC-type iron transport system FetAB ATPase subunit
MFTHASLPLILSLCALVKKLLYQNNVLIVTEHTNASANQNRRQLTVALHRLLKPSAIQKQAKPEQ